MSFKYSLLVVGLLLSNSVAADLRFEEGVARDPGSQQTLYREQHWLRFNQDVPVERLVLYRCMDGTAFARKRVNYLPSNQAPAFELLDARRGFVEGLRYLQKTAELWYQPSQKAPEKNVLIATGNLVADAGFDEFIRSHWLKLRAGNSLSLRFAVPTRLSAYKFSLKQMGETQIAGIPAVRFQLKLSGFLSLLGDPIEVTYDKASKRLLRFQGISNLRNDAGQFDLQSQIDFPKEARVATEAEWQKSAATPLASCALKR